MATQDMRISRAAAAELGQQTVAILKRGWYESSGGRRIEIAGPVEAARGGTVAYPPDTEVPATVAGDKATEISVENTTTLDAARRLFDQDGKVVVLNFASAKRPGGGFLSGARAQEEYLARSSGLYTCLCDQPMYQYHAERQDAFYSDYCLYSPDVPVIRDDAGRLLDESYSVSVITAAAVNAKHVPAERRTEIEAVMKWRIEKVLAIGLLHEHRAIVLGAWGCGAFGNDTSMIAGLFGDALRQTFRGVYQRVVFAVTDWSEECRFIGPFEERFAGGA